MAREFEQILYSTLFGAAVSLSAVVVSLVLVRRWFGCSGWLSGCLLLWSLLVAFVGLSMLLLASSAIPTLRSSGTPQKRGAP